ncbi:MAG TPA: hypothetical protein VFS18_00890, partial [Actinomycetota bacterium]|nr:hypothetical protein [Actinomycetota bacterium]
MSAGTLLAALAQLVILGGTGYAVGNRILRKVFSERHFGAPERALAAVIGILVFSVALMLAHIATRGFVFGTPGVVPLAALVVLGVSMRVPSRPRPRRWDVVALILLGAVLMGIYLVPALAAGSSVRTGDPPWHLGWTEQLLAGEPVPVGPAPELARNAYPWGYHSVIATAVRLVPGT